MLSLKELEDQLNRLLNLGAPQVIIENQKKNIEKARIRWSKREDLAKQLISKLKRDSEEKYSMNFTIRKTEQKGIAGAFGFKGKEAVMLFCNLTVPYLPDRIVICLVLDVNSDQIAIVSDALPNFLNNIPLVDQYKKIDFFNKFNPHIKVYLNNYVKEGKKANGPRVLSMTKNNEFHLEPITSQLFNVIDFVLMQIPHLLEFNEMWNQVNESRKKEKLTELDSFCSLLYQYRNKYRLLSANEEEKIYPIIGEYFKAYSEIFQHEGLYNLGDWITTNYQRKPRVKLDDGTYSLGAFIFEIIFLHLHVPLEKLQKLYKEGKPLKEMNYQNFANVGGNFHSLNGLGTYTIKKHVSYDN